VQKSTVYLGSEYLGLSFLASLNHQLFKNIAYVGYFGHFVICCICVFVYLRICICVFVYLTVQNIIFDFLTYIFNVSENTVIIHLIMVIWLSNFTMSSFKLAPGPPQILEEVKRIFSKSKEMIHRIFSVKIKYQTCF